MATYYCHECARLHGHICPVDPSALSPNDYQLGNYVKHTASTDDLPPVPIEPAVAEIVRTDIARQVMPRSPVGDALHLALASYHRCDFLVTWNCRHLANANKFDHISPTTLCCSLPQRGKGP